MSKLEKIMFTAEALSTERSKDSSVKKYSLCALCRLRRELSSGPPQSNCRCKV